MDERVTVVGVHGGTWFGRRAGEALVSADLVVGWRVALDTLPPDLSPDRRVPVDSITHLLETVESGVDQGRRVVVVAGGDPGFFGILRVLAGRLSPSMIEVCPAPSSVALAFARIGLPWDDATVLSCHGRPLEAIVDDLIRRPKTAVLVSPETPPEAVGKALISAQPGADRRVWVCIRLGEPGEEVVETDLAGLAGGRFDTRSVVVLCRPGFEVAPTAAVAWGRPEAVYRHRDRMITKAEVRAVALSKLDLYPAATMWDVGAGSGSVAVEAATLAPGLRVYAIERDPEQCRLIRLNSQGQSVTVVPGAAPGCLHDLPDPDRVFVGGGGIPVLETVIDRLTPGGIVVATYATLGPALTAADRLGNMVQVQVSRARSLGENRQLRLEAENPVFVVWGSPS